MIEGNSRKENKIKKHEIEVRDKFSRVYISPPYQNRVEIASYLNELKPVKNEVILDAGCGTGRITFELIKAGVKVIALDFSMESLKVCGERCTSLSNDYPEPFLIRADVCHIPLKDGIVDKCFSSQVFEHIPSKESRVTMLQEIYRTLKLGGKLILSTYNYNLRKRISGKKEGYQADKVYYYRYSYKEFKNIIHSVFSDDKIRIKGVINLVPWTPIRIAEALGKPYGILDIIIEKTPLSYLLGHLLSVECKKVQK